MRTKRFDDGRLEIKDAARGEVVAAFARLGVVDHDGDVTLPGAFTNGAQVRISAYNHASWGPGALPVGKGTIREVGDEAVMTGRFFLNTTSGRETFEIVKQLGSLGEWSYGYRILDSEHGEFEGQRVQFLKKLDVTEVSPVLQGAGIDTRTLAVKAHGGDDPQAVLRRSVALLARSGVVLSGHRDPALIGDPISERLYKSGVAIERLWRLEVRGRVG